MNDAYAAEPFYKLCHGAQNGKVYNKSPEIQKELFKILCEADVESELGQHTKTYRSSSNNIIDNSLRVPKNVLKTLINESNNSKSPVICDLTAVYAVSKISDDAYRILIKFLQTSIWEKYLINFTMKISSQEQAIFFNKYVSVTVDRAKEILFSTMKQSSPLWLVERSRRITGSICYSLYTYMKNIHTELEWEKKLSNTYCSKFKGNKHTLRGKECEEKARCKYKEVTGHTVQDLGLLVLSTSSWLGFSADGLANNNILIEIKSPKNDENVEASSLLKTLPYVQFQDGKPVLKRRHEYYGQVQLGLCLLDIELCHFVVYESFNGTCAIIDVIRDDEFIKDLVPTLSNCYFQRVLPWLTSNYKKNIENAK